MKWKLNSLFELYLAIYNTDPVLQNPEENVKTRKMVLKICDDVN